jgi:hypothetical protein
VGAALSARVASAAVDPGQGVARRALVCWQRRQRSIEMIEFEFDGALQLSSGIAEALHAAGADVGVPVPDDTPMSWETVSTGHDRL